MTLLKPRGPTRITNTPINADQLLTVRWPDRAGLLRVIDRAKKTSARGLVFFQLPHWTAPSGWSLRQLGHLETKPQLLLRKTKGSQELELVNKSDADLEPRLSSAGGQGELDPGYALELEAPAAIFRDAQEGDFWRVVGHAETGEARRAVALPLATQLTFWFSHLRARQSWRTRFERVDDVLVERCDENHDRQCVWSKLLDHTEAVHSGQLDIEQERVELESLPGFERTLPVRTFAPWSRCRDAGPTAAGRAGRHQRLGRELRSSRRKGIIASK